MSAIVLARRRVALACALCAWGAAAHAQPSTQAAPTAVTSSSAPAAPAAAVQTIVITGNPLRQSGLAAASVLTGDALTRARQGTLGDTLAGLPGVAATGFAPLSSRPVIRGLDGDRIRLLDNGSTAVDASSLSFDHAPATDPLVVERLEVVRGPAALLYGGNATGGVVNAIDNRIPRTPYTPQAGLGGRAEVRCGGAGRERAGAAVVEGGAGGLNWHADLAARKSGDVRAPKDFEASRVLNSGGNSRAGAVGGSWADADGHVGAAIDTMRTEYGVVVEPEVTIDMERSRLLLDGERRWSAGLLRELAFSLSGTRYEHQELEGAEVGTTFKSRGEELRLQARHAPWSGIRGVVGLQADALRFSALGDEAFVPNTRTRSAAVFTLQSWQSSPQAEPGALTLTGGLRTERVRVSSEGDAPDAAEPKFGPAQRRSFSPASASLAAAWALSPGWQLNAQLGLTQRAPTYYELYANGIHVATGAFERGDPTLGLERSGHVELGAQWMSDAQGTRQLKAQFFSTRFSRYIALDATGTVVEEVGEGGEVETFPEYAFRAVPARLQGFELEGRTRLLTAPWQVDAVGQWDGVRGSNRDTGEALPRLAPMRLALGLQARQGPWWASLALRHAARQRRVPALDVPTPGATVIDAALQWQQRMSDVDVLLFARLDNIADRLAFNAVALRTARELSPLPGRALTVGARLNW